MGVLLQKDYLEISRIDKNVFLSISNLEIFIRQFIKMVLNIIFLAMKGPCNLQRLRHTPLSLRSAHRL